MSCWKLLVIDAIVDADMQRKYLRVALTLTLKAATRLLMTAMGCIECPSRCMGVTFICISSLIRSTGEKRPYTCPL
jgi:hypothetical protein